MTRRLYNEDSYMQSFHANVISCEAHTETTYKVVLDRTAFFPEGGGQSSDKGSLGGIAVLDVQELKSEQEDVIHIVEVPLEVGSEVQGIVDWKQRFDKMQQHTAEHIASGIISKTYGYNNVGFHLNEEIVTMDFDGVITRTQGNELEALANDAIFANVAVEVLYPTSEELEIIEYRSKIEIDGQVRLVRVGMYDTCACCAPHVKTTGEIGLVKFTDIQSHRGGVRITMKCGRRALLDYQSKSASVKALSGMLSAKEEEVVQGVERLQEEIQNARANNWSLQKHMVQCRVEAIHVSEAKPWILHFEEVLDVEHTRELVNQWMMKAEVVMIFRGNDIEGYQYILGSQRNDIRGLGKALNERCNGRGGGKPMMVQGSVKASRSEIEQMVYQMQEEGEF